MLDRERFRGNLIRRNGLFAAGIAVALLAVVGSSVSWPHRASYRSTPVCAGVIAPPAGGAPLLPTDRGVGAATLLYQPCPACDPYLVTATGEQYRLDPDPGGSPPEATSSSGIPSDALYGSGLSPDGRWLFQISAGEGLHVRDLTGTRRYVLTNAFDVGAWSADSRWMVEGDGTEGPELIEIATGRRRDIHLGPQWNIIGIHDNGDLVVTRRYNRLDSDPDPRREEIRTVEPDSGVVRRRVTVASGLHDSLRYTGGHLVGWASADEDGAPDVVVFPSLTSGEIAGRFRLPTDSPGVHGFSPWSPLGGINGQLLLERRARSGYQPGPSGSPVPIPEPVELVLLDPVSGSRRTACRLPPHAVVRTPG